MTNSDITWSYSTRSVFEQCLRKYFYQAYVADKRKKIDLLKEKREHIHFLKNLKNCDLRTGELMHMVIRWYFSSAKQENYIGVDELVGFASSRFQRDIDYSRKYPKGNEKVLSRYKDYPPMLLQEFYYEQEDALQLCREAKERMEHALENFATNPLYDVFRQGGKQADAVVERKFSIGIHDVSVVGVVDLAFQNDEEVRIVDWKIGEASNDGSSSFQLATYSLWALDFYKCALTNLSVNMIHLAQNQIVSSDIDQDKLSATRIRILQDSEHFRLLDHYGRKGNENAFTPLLNPKVCSLCPYFEVCYARN